MERGMSAVTQKFEDILIKSTIARKTKGWERLLIYLIVSEVAVRAVLVREDEGKQSLIYYVSKSLLDAETRYPQLEKLALTLIMASRKLRPYFQCHPIAVVTAYPLHNILHKHELSGRLPKWAIELSEYNITYKPRTAIKSQVLDDFVADFSKGMQLEAEKELHVFNGANLVTWTLFTNGSSNVKGAGLGIVLVPPTGETIQQAIKCHSITNNEAEYEAVIVIIGPKWKKKRNVSWLNVINAKGTKRLEESKGNWLEVLPGVLWAYRTTAKTSTREIPFSLVYGAEALIPVEIGEPSTRFTHASKESNDEEMHVNLDLLEGRREVVLIRMTAQKHIIERYYNRKACLKFFKIWDFVLKKVFQYTKASNAGKLAPTWEGPYRIHDIAGKGAYELETMDGKILPSHWNVVHLKRYYF
ncbi:uncharacterized protein [Nicotiana sylvestris]|uniref:uncharacterized protein n=1 Tax=Nicotiana sylvestris TaxID=4096 RepID=UPI00388C6BE0